MILVVGDIHSSWKQFNELIQKKRPEVVLQCGDFGFWPGHRFYDPAPRIKPGKAHVHWVDGNHENHEAIQEKIASGNLSLSEELPNVLYQPRGSTFQLSDGRTVLFAGGAFSVDNRIRMPSVDWFPELEILTEKELDGFPSPDAVQIDIVISHTAPSEFCAKGIPADQWPEWFDRDPDPSMETLSKVLARYNPTLWFFGHFHLFQQGTYGDCQWMSLDQVGSGSKWWTELPRA
jgi:hypothetical protein